MPLSHSYAAICLIALSLAVGLSGCRRLSPMGYMMTDSLKEEAKEEIPVRIYGRLLSSKGQPLAGVVLGIRHSSVNWPGYAWGGSPARVEVVAVTTDADGCFHYKSDRGGTIAVIEPRELWVYVDDHWETWDDKRSDMVFNYYEEGSRYRRLPFIPSAERPAQIYLRPPKSLSEQRRVSAETYHWESQGVELGTGFQAPNPGWPPEGELSGYAADG